MEVLTGTIIHSKAAQRGFWYTISSLSGNHKFFSKKEIFSLFEECEVVLERKNNTYFISDFNQLDEIPPLRKNPGNLIAASWLSQLATSFMLPDKKEMDFIDRCRFALSVNFNIESLVSIENDYFEVSGFSGNDNRENILIDCFPYSFRLRQSLLKQITVKGGQND